MTKQTWKILPPPTPNRKEFPFVGTVKIHGLTVHLENLAGSWREGKGWRTRMKNHYGEILGTKGTDKDKLDVYLGPNPKSKRVFVVHQNNPKTGLFDEDKVVLACDTPEEAKQLYLAHYDSPKFFRSITEWDLEKFKKAIFGESKGEKVAHWERVKMAAEEIAGCATPGQKIRSGGKGRGMGAGGGQGPIGVPLDEKVKSAESACKTPGEKKRSEGAGRGAAKGGGKGPIGVPLVHKLREFASARKKKDAAKRKASAFIREKMR
jgi:hypothetical protein